LPASEASGTAEENFLATACVPPRVRVSGSVARRQHARKP
jgi:hypothetical protein